MWEFWRIVFTRWDDATALDLHEFYGVDVLEAYVPERPWWWLRTRITGLLDRHESRLSNLVRRAATS